MGLFDFLRKKPDYDYSTAKNEGLRAISTRFRGSKEDTVLAITSRLCPTCSIYNRRIYSLYGRYKAFPILPSFLQNDVCPMCGVHIGYAHYFPGITGNLQKDIKFSNRPFVDSRTHEEKSLWNDRITKEAANQKIDRDFKWICDNLPEIAPKSLGGYKRMTNSNSQNYKRIVSAAKDKGHII